MMMMAIQDILERVDLKKRTEQLALSQRIFDKAIPARIIAARLGKKEAIDHDWQRSKAGSIAINTSADGYPFTHTNYGVAFSEGWLDADIDSDDSNFAICVVRGLALKGVRVEYSWGRKTHNGALVPSHIIFKIIGNPDDLRRMFPVPVRIGRELSRVEFAYAHTDPKSRKRPDPTKHAIIPGSVTIDQASDNASLVSWIDYKRDTTPSAQELVNILGGIALGSLIYAVKDYWVEGDRHNFALKFSGALAHILADVERINSEPHHPLFGNVLTPLDSDELAARLIQAICESYGDGEHRDRISAFRDARTKLASGGKIPGRTALKEHTGSSGFADLMWALLIAGTSLSAVHEIHADLILDATDEKYIRYISRGRFKDGVTYHYQREAVQNLWKGKTVTIGRSTKPAFDVYEMGDREEATGGIALLPDHASGELLLTKNGRVLPDDYDGDMHGVLSVFNTWRGFKHKPIKHRDAARGGHVVAMLIKLLGYVTRDNEAQIRFILCWIADLIQYPGDKLPVAIVLMGGKGWGKSTVLTFIRRLVGDELTGFFTNTILAGKFLGDVAKNKLCVFGNELKKLTSDVEKVTLGNLVKDSFIATEGKNIRASTHANLARVAIATNSEEFNITTTDSPRGEPERALFYARSHNNLSLGVSQAEYEERRNSLRPFFEELYELMESEQDMDHLMWFLSEFKYSRDELFNTSASSFNDADVLKHNLDYPTSALMRLLSENNFGGGYDSKFSDALRWGSPMTVIAIRAALDQYSNVDSRYAVKANDVIERMFELGLAERRGQHIVPIVKYGTALERFKQRVKVPVPPAYELAPDDHGLIDPNSIYIPPPKIRR
jgi:hypothetical protein